MTNSILNSTKKNLGLPAEYTAFDVDVLMHINSVLAILEQLGVGPVGGFYVEDHVAEWGDLLGTDPRLNPVKTYVYLRVRLLFDPPTNSFTINALQEQIREIEWRLNVHVEDTAWVDPDPDPLPVE